MTASNCSRAGDAGNGNARSKPPSTGATTSSNPSTRTSSARSACSSADSISTRSRRSPTSRAPPRSTRSKRSSRNHSSCVSTHPRPRLDSALLETLKAYAEDRLIQIDEAARIRDRHADHYHRLTMTLGRTLLPDARLGARLRVDRANISSAIEWALLNNQLVRAGELLLGSYEAYDSDGHVAEAVGLYERCVGPLSDLDRELADYLSTRPHDDVHHPRRLGHVLRGRWAARRVTRSTRPVRCQRGDGHPDGAVLSRCGGGASHEGGRRPGDRAGERAGKWHRSRGGDLTLRARGAHGVFA